MPKMQVVLTSESQIIYQDYAMQTSLETFFVIYVSRKNF